MTTAIAKRDIRDEIFPRGGPESTWVQIQKKKLTGECSQCGRCCLALHLSEPLEKVKKYLEENPEPDPEWDELTLEAYRTHEHIVRYFVPWNDWDAESRGLLHARLFWCRLLTKSNGKYICPLHGRSKPEICSGYPVYEKLGGRDGSCWVKTGCGYIGEE